VVRIKQVDADEQAPLVAVPPDDPAAVHLLARSAWGIASWMRPPRRTELQVGRRERRPRFDLQRVTADAEPRIFSSPGERAQWYFCAPTTTA
jgi:hypothetical protein